MGNGLRSVCAVVAFAALAGCASEPVGRRAGYPGAYQAPSHDRPGAHSGDPGRMLTIRCESDHGRTRHCDIDTRGGALDFRDSLYQPTTAGALH